MSREFEEPLKTLVKTNNPIEISRGELQRRIRPFGKFVNVTGVERIVYGIIVYVLDTQS